jgi:hypothetical protein
MKFTSAILALLVGAASLSAFAYGSLPKPVFKPNYGSLPSPK